MNRLVVYYSLSGTTRTVATALAQELGADIEELRCDRYSPGFWGYLRAGYDSWRGKLPDLEPLSHTPSEYGLVVLGGPIWSWHPSTPIRAFLQQESAGLPDVAFFLTQGGSAAERALRELEQLARQAPQGKLVVREADVKTEKFASAISSFAASLKASEDTEPRQP